MKKIASVLAIVISLLCFTSISSAQFEKGKNYVGPHLGLSYYGSTITFGGEYEYGVTEHIGIGGLVDYYQYSEDFGGWSGDYSWKYSYLEIGANGNYHFGKTLEWDGKLDPFVGVVLGYHVASVKWDGPGSAFVAEPSVGGVFLGGTAGIRYFISPNLALAARVGVGATYLTAGVNWKF